MKKLAKKIAPWICVAASVCVIGTTVSGYLADKNAEEPTTGTEQVQVIE
jgi:hypothetical protein